MALDATLQVRLFPLPGKLPPLLGCLPLAGDLWGVQEGGEDAGAAKKIDEVAWQVPVARRAPTIKRWLLDARSREPTRPPLREPKRKTRAESVFYRTNLLAPLVLALQNSSTLAMKKEVTKANSALCIRGLIHSALSRALKVIVVHGHLS